MLFDEKLIEIASITIPVFALTAVGKVMDLKGVFTSEGKKSLSWITYYMALPALIFSAFMKTNSSNLFSIDLVILSLLAIVVTGTITKIATHFVGLSKTKAAATTYCSYWGNNGYMGIPLIMSALGKTTGLALGAVINGMATPFFIATALFLMYHAKEQDHAEKEAMKKEITKTIFNPVMLALISGVVISFIRAKFMTNIEPPQIMRLSFEVMLKILDHLGEMGLPLALILVGSNLRLGEIHRDRVPLLMAVAGKLICAPLVVFFAAKNLFPNLPKESFVAIVLLNAVPVAVASYIISDKMEIESQLVSSTLVISTAFSIITIPMWLYFIL